MDWRTILVEVWFWEGIRKNPHYGNTYRPHFVIKDTDEYYSGVQFEYLQEAPLGEHIIARVQLVYESLGVDYSNFTPGIRFDIRERSRTVGEGIVLENTVNENSN